MTNNISKRILITGADGFIGRHLVAELHKRKNAFVAATRNPQILAGQQTIVVGDIDANTDWRQALTGCSKVIHLAGRAHVLSNDKAAGSNKFKIINEEGTRNLALQATEMGVQRLLFLSTIALYDPQFTQIFLNSSLRPETDYGRSKRAAEQHLRALTHSSMSHTILRTPLVYGPGVGGRFLQLLNLVHHRVPLPISAIRNQRSLIYVSNLVDLIIHALEHEKAANQTFLVCDNETISTASMFKILAKGMGRSSFLWPFPKPLLDLGAAVFRRSGPWYKLTGTLVIDGRETENNLAWTPPYSLEQGLAHTAAWYASARSAR